MEKRHFEKLDATTSLLGFGCMRFPVTSEGDIDKETTFKMLDYAYDHGVNYYDTAYPYHGGKSEVVLGEWLQTKDRNTLYITTKCPTWLIKSEEDVEKHFNEQLSKLQTDYFDFYLIHALSKDRWELVEKFHIFEHLSELKKQGKIKRLGFSFHDEYPVFETIIKAKPWDFCQIQYNYMDTNIQAGDAGYKLSESLGIPMVIMEPIKGGSLAKLPGGLCAPDNKSAASLALRWVASHPNVYTVLSGMSDFDQVKDNISTFEHFQPITEEDTKVIEKAKEIFASRIVVPCTGCRYCMPCPFGVDIPGCFSVINEGSIYEIDNTKRYGFLEEGKASACQKCGACETKCPQHIQIRSMLETVKEKYE